MREFLLICAALFHSSVTWSPEQRRVYRTHLVAPGTFEIRPGLHPFLSAQMVAGPRRAPMAEAVQQPSEGRRGET